MKDDLHVLKDWFFANKLSLNIAKSNYVLFSKTNQINIGGNNPHHLELAGGVIERSNHTNFLGLYIDQNLSWNEHIKVCKSRLASALYAINKVKHLVPMRALLNIYNTLVYPHLSYGIILWGNTYQTYLNNIIISQKKIVRSMLNMGYTDHTHPLFFELKLLKFVDIYRLEVAKFMFSYTHMALPEPLSNLFNYTTNVHDHQTRQSEAIRANFFRTTTADKSALNTGPDIWNKLPDYIKTKRNIKSFAHGVRKYIFINYEHED